MHSSLDSFNVRSCIYEGSSFDVFAVMYDDWSLVTAPTSLVAIHPRPVRRGLVTCSIA